MGLSLNKRAEALPALPAKRQRGSSAATVSVPMTASPRRRRMAIASSYV